MSGYQWLSGREAARRLQIVNHSMPRVAAANGIRRRVIRGLPVKYHAGDVDRLAVECVQGEGVNAGQDREAASA